MRELLGYYTPDMKLADLHVHTNDSPDTRNKGMSPNEVVELADKTGLSAVAITDHHSVRAAHMSREYSEKIKTGVEVVVGIEIDTKQGHILGLFVENPIQRQEHAEAAIEEIHKQGGLAIIPHPFMKPILRSYPAGMRFKDLDSMIESGVAIDGFEVYSQGAEDVSVARRTDKGNTSNDIALTTFKLLEDSLGAALASSDAHGLTIGRARTAFSGDLREAIEQRLTIPLRLDANDQLGILKASRDLFGRERLENSTSKLRRNLSHLRKPEA